MAIATLTAMIDAKEGDHDASICRPVNLAARRFVFTSVSPVTLKVAL